jgi:hypothetical protein
MSDRSATGLRVADDAPESGAGKLGLDRVTLNVIDRHLANITDEMVRAMIRAAYSPIFSESQDFSCMLFDKRGQMISQAEMNPAIICAALHTVPATMEYIGIDNLAPGDVVIQNDPYRSICCCARCSSTAGSSAWPRTSRTSPRSGAKRRARSPPTQRRCSKRGFASHR